MTGQRATIRATTIAEPAPHLTLAQLVAVLQRDGIPIIDVWPDHGERGGVVVGIAEHDLNKETEPSPV